MTAGMVRVREMVAGMVAAGLWFSMGRSRGVKVMVMLPEVAGMVWSWCGLLVGIPESDTYLWAGI